MKRLHPVQHLVFKIRRWEEGYQAFMLISESVLCNSKKTVPLTFSMKACKIIPLYYAFVIYFLASLHPAILSTGHHFFQKNMDVLLQSFPSAFSQNYSDFTYTTVCQECENTNPSQKCQNFLLEFNLHYAYRINCIQTPQNIERFPTLSDGNRNVKEAYGR